MTRNVLWVVALSWCAVLGGSFGCSGGGPHRIDAPGGGRDSALAERLNAEAAAEMADDPERAWALLERALEADGFFGPAYNNRGVLLLGRGRLYDAAVSFERAHRLMAGHPGPLVNLGLTLERGGRVDEAIIRYREALDVAPDDLAACCALVRCQVRFGREDELTEGRLRTIAERSDGAWGDWARLRLLP